ncbi:MAG: ABC transporter permease [Myxococcales bacterium]|nr:ABC transporter permease [Myxococcales bacterium]
MATEPFGPPPVGHEPPRAAAPSREPPGPRRARVFFAFVVKEWKHVLRDRKSLIILLGLPVVMMILFGFALSNEVKSTRFVVLDPTPDATTIAITERLDQSRYFALVGRVDDEAALLRSFRRGEARVAVVFQAGFDRALRHDLHAQVRVVADASDANTAATVTAYASAIIAQVQADLAGPAAARGGIAIETRMLYNPQLKSSYMFVPGVMTLILMLLGAMMTSVSIVREKETGTMEILLVSPMNPLVVIVSKAVPYLLLCFIDVLIILGLSYGLLDMPTGANVPLLLAECLLFIVATLALGLVISNVVATQQTAMFISLVGLLMPSLVFSGFMFPIQNMPLPLRVFSNVVPTKWFYLIVSDVMIKHLGFAAVIKPTLILVGMTVGLLAIALKTFRQRL